MGVDELRADFYWGRSVPLDLQFRGPCGGNDLKIIAILVEEIVLFEQLRPLARPKDDAVHELGSCSPVIQHHIAGEEVRNPAYLS